MDRILKRTLVWVGLAGFLLLATVGAALLGEVSDSSEGFTLEAIEVEANVLPDRSMEVTERVSYDFGGTLSRNNHISGYLVSMNFWYKPLVC